MTNLFDKYRYGLLKIGFSDPYIFEDLFDNEKYLDCRHSNSIEELLDYAVQNFSKENPSMNQYNDWEANTEDGAKDFVLIHPHGAIFRSSMLLLPGVMGAILLIRKYHIGQTRKGGGYPYLEHPLEVGYNLWKEKFPIDVVVAGYCHDLLEDTKCTEKEIIMNCGQDVLNIVKAVSNDESLSDKENWEKKKEKYINSVEAGGEKAIAVSVMDKICNLQSFFDQYDKEGPGLWKSFNRGKEQKIWFEKAVLEMAKKHWQHPLLNQYEQLIKKQENC